MNKSSSEYMSDEINCLWFYTWLKMLIFYQLMFSSFEPLSTGKIYQTLYDVIMEIWHSIMQLNQLRRQNTVTISNHHCNKSQVWPVSCSPWIKLTYKSSFKKKITRSCKKTHVWFIYICLITNWVAKTSFS